MGTEKFFHRIYNKTSALHIMIIHQIILFISFIYPSIPNLISFYSKLIFKAEHVKSFPIIFTFICIL